jgi:GGDEF domain-containing protein
MISFSPYLKSSRGSVPMSPAAVTGRQAEALNRVISVLMQGIALHGLQYDETAFRTFQDAVWKMRAGFDQATDEDSAMLLAGAVIRLLEEHNDAAQTNLKARHQEISAMVGMLSETLLEVTQANQQTVANLRGMTHEISRASSMNALVAVKSRLDISMAELRAKALLCSANTRGGQITTTATDAVTGLPDAVTAIEALARVWPRRAGQYLGLFALEYLETINQRFGFRSGDELLQLLGQQVGKHFSHPDQLFRWRGPCLVALIDRHAPESFVASEFARAIPPRLENATTVRDREAMVRVSTSWSMFRLEEISSLDEAISRMNEFSGSRSRYVRQVSAGS